jgi:DNA-damage-inducible protein D
MEKEIVSRLHKHFEEFTHEQDGVEFWYARELQKLLGYDEWRNFEGVLEKAKTTCTMAGQ